MFYSFLIALFTHFKLLFSAYFSQIFQIFLSVFNVLWKFNFEVRKNAVILK